MEQIVINEEAFIIHDKESRAQNFDALRKVVANGSAVLVLHSCNGTESNAYPSAGFPLFAPLTQWSAYRIVPSPSGVTETVAYNAPSPIDIVNIAVDKQDYAMASLAFYSACQMYNSRPTKWNEDNEPDLGLSEAAKAIFSSYRTTCLTTLPRIQDYFNHYLEELLDSGNCSNGYKDCADTYVTLSMAPMFSSANACDPWTFLRRFLSETQNGLQIAPSTCVRLARREKAKVDHDKPYAIKCLGCLCTAETRIYLILSEFRKRLFGILRNDERSIREFHNWLFDVRA